MASLCEEFNSIRTKRGSIGSTIKKDFDKSVSRFTERSNFFTPIRTFSDAVITVSYPFVGTIGWGLLALLEGIFAAISAVLFLVAYFFSKAASCFSEQVANRTMEAAASCAFISLLMAASALVAAINALIVFPVTGIQAITRTGATVVELMTDCCTQDEAQTALEL